MTLVEKAIEFIRNRRLAYVRTFETQQPANVLVLEDLARFCRANETTFDLDPRMSAMLEGRREVWLRIQQHLQLTDEQLFALYSGNGAAYQPKGNEK